MLQGNEMEFGLALVLFGAGFMLLTFRLLIVDGRKRKYTPRHSVYVEIEYVPPEYHPVYDNDSTLVNPYPTSWFNAVVKRGKYGHTEPLWYFMEKCEEKIRRRERLTELRLRHFRRLELRNWKWLEIPWKEWKDLYPQSSLVSV